MEHLLDEVAKNEAKEERGPLLRRKLFELRHELEYELRQANTQTRER